MSDPQSFTAKKVVNVHYSRGIDHVIITAFDTYQWVRCVKGDIFGLEFTGMSNQRIRIRLLIIVWLINLLKRS